MQLQTRITDGLENSHRSVSRCSSSNANDQPAPFLTLPAEIHTLIAHQLPYPDLLSLTLAHPLFTTHSIISTKKSHRVNWLISRATSHLPIPTQLRCRWSSDREFVSSPEVTSMLRRRRMHVECVEVWEKGHSAGECLVLGGKERCTRIKPGDRRENGKWIDRVTFGGLGAYLVRVRSGTGRDEGSLELVRSTWIALAAAIVAAWFWFLV